MGARRVNTAVTSRQALLAASRAVARRQGLDGLSIRAVAAEAEVSVGSVYNYFSGKAELMAATVEEIWGQILSAPEAEPPEDFVSCVHGLFRRIRGRGWLRFNSGGFAGSRVLGRVLLRKVIRCGFRGCHAGQIGCECRSRQAARHAYRQQRAEYTFFHLLIQLL